MPITRTLGCPDCGQSFRWLFMTEDDWPSHCARCGNRMDAEPQEIPGGFSIGTEKGKSVDQTYRQMEDASIARAEAAGDPAMKMTNLKDNLREGDTAGIVPNNAVTQVAAEMGHNYFQGGSTDALIAQSKTGRERSTGSVALRAIQGGASGNFTPPTPSIKGSFGGGTG